MSYVLAAILGGAIGAVFSGWSGAIILTILSLLGMHWAVTKDKNDTAPKRTISSNPATAPPETTYYKPAAAAQERPEDSNAYPRDAWEGTFREGNNNYNVMAVLMFDYVDGKGMKTTRTVEVREADDELKMIMGHCRLRDDTRTFRYDRMSNCVDVETGEIVEDVEEHLYNRYLKSPEYALLKFTEDNLNFVKCLVFIGKADGQMRSEEKQIIAEICSKSASNSHITKDTILGLIAKLQAPSLQGFKIAVGKIANSNIEQLKLLSETAVSIVNTQKTIHPHEQVALDYISKKVQIVYGS